jgi:hypothetical protein
MENIECGYYQDFEDTAQKFELHFLYSIKDERNVLSIDLLVI